MLIKLCRHIKTNGRQCRAAALTRSSLCYFHTGLHKRHAPYRQTDVSRLYLHLVPGQNIELCPLEDRESVQIALSTVINALATGNLDPKRATALLYSLQLASANCARLCLEPYVPDAVRNVHTAPEDSATPDLDLAPTGAVYDTEPILDLDLDDDPDEDQEDNAFELEVQDRVNERVAVIKAQMIEAQRLATQEIPETISTIQATAETPHQTGHQTGWPILCGFLTKGGLSSYARPHSLTPSRTPLSARTTPPTAQNTPQDPRHLLTTYHASKPA
jgi:hypothetical protein